MVELNKKKFADLLENSFQLKYSVEQQADKIDVSSDCLYRVLAEKEISLPNFLKILYWVKQEKMLSFDQIFHLILRREE